MASSSSSFFFFFLDDTITITSSKVCAIKDGTTANSNDCTCGTSDCDTTTGLSCLASANKCIKHEACVKKDGQFANDAGCMCGIKLCDVASGFFCLASANKCMKAAQTATCSNTDGSAINGAACTCGTSDCDSAKGLYCYSNDNRCAKGSPCINNGGSTVNNNPCTCGSNDCTSDNGLFCLASIDKCAKSKIVACSINDGSSVNANDCLCGSSDCTSSTGRYCVSALNVCTAKFVPGDITLSGSLKQSSLMGKYLWLGTTLTNGKPAYKFSSYYLYWDSTSKIWAVGPSLGGTAADIYWSNDVLRPELSPSPTAIKEASSGAWQDDTMVIVSSKACAVANALSVNTRECTCGTSDCDAGTGMYCFAFFNKCATVAACSNTGGSTINDNKCLCSENICDSTEGLFCQSSSSKCSKLAVCVNKDGSSINDKNCLCGTSECDSTKGLFCQSSSNSCSKVAVCVNKDGSSINDNDCICGTNECDSSKGLFCRASSNKCGKLAACVNKDGSSVNGNDCICGTSECDSTKGLFCRASSNKCGTLAPCVNKDGVSANEIECTCGTNDCTKSTGMFCDFSLSSCATSDFVPGDLTLSGSKRELNQALLMGKFIWSGKKNEKPFYKLETEREDNTIYVNYAYKNVYLYWYSKLARWQISYSLVSDHCLIWWKNNVARPEFTNRATTKMTRINDGTLNGEFQVDTFTITSSKDCANKNGNNINEYKCTCGSTDCVGTRMYCRSKSNKCSSLKSDLENLKDALPDGKEFPILSCGATSVKNDCVYGGNLRNIVNCYMHSSFLKKQQIVFLYGNIIDWDVSQVTNMAGVFEEKTFTGVIQQDVNISKWDVSNVHTFSKSKFF